MTPYYSEILMNIGGTVVLLSFALVLLVLPMWCVIKIMKK
jgi:hypothetical protein